MKAVPRRILLVLMIVLTAAILSGAGGVFFYKRPPAWYVPRRLNHEQWALAARNAEDKMVVAYNWATRSQARYSARMRSTAPIAATAPADQTTVTFTLDELNSFFQKWQNAGNAPYSRYVADPVIAIKDNRVILAGLVKSLGTVLSLHFEPSLDAEGKLHLELKRILGGQLPLPMSVWTSQRQRILSEVTPILDQWRRQAHMDANGATNDAGMAAAATQLLLTVLDNTAADPVIFLPTGESRGMPVRLTDLQLTDTSITLRVQSMTRDQRKAFFDRLRNPAENPTALR